MAARTFFIEPKNHHPDTTVILVRDSAPCRRPKVHREIPGLIALFLPPHSPELNPAERFFRELRTATANRMFKNSEEQEHAIAQKLHPLADDSEGMKRVVGYEWIRKQTEQVSEGWYYYGSL